ncbi:MAG: hypothetical protein RLZZ44_1463 [Bacteroidota bacterium]|jgi:dTDP-4-dehydrorhamnose reductase
MKRVLIIGSSGLLGKAVVAGFSQIYKVTVSYHNTENSKTNLDFVKLNLFDEKNLELTLINLIPDIVINCAGLSSVDLCEKLPEKAYLLNAHVPLVLARLAKKVGFKLVHISTDHFYSEIKSPRAENVEMRPVNKYGYSKLLGEDYMINYLPESLILRTNFFTYAPNSIGYFGKLINDLQSNSVYLGFEDVIFTPVGAKTLTQAIEKAISANLTGIYNISSTEELSKYEFALILKNILIKNETKIIPSNSQTVSERVTRPTYLSLSPKKFLNSIQFKMPSIEDMIVQELNSYGGKNE